MSSELRRLWEQAGGKVPDDWKIVPFESLFRDNKSIAVGVMYPGPNTAGGAPLLKVGDIKDGLVPERPTYCISAATNEEHKRTQLVGDELLITLVGNPGECVVATRAMVGWNPARAIAVVRLRDPSLRTYLKTVLESTPSKHLIDAVLNTTVQKTLNLKDVRQLPIPLPSGCVIEEISGIADSLIHRIALLRETNATLEAIAQAMFKSWFVDFDPVHAKQQGRAPEGMSETTAALFPESFEESELGLVPMGWGLSTLGSICEASGGHIQTGPFGSQLHASDYVVAGWPVVMPKDIDNRRVNTSSVARIDNENAQRLSRHRLQKHDIVFSRRGDVEKHALIGEAEEGWICGTGCLLVRPGEQSNSPGYLSLALHQPKTRQWLTQHAVGAIMPNLNTGILSAVPILLPSPQILEEFECLVEVLECRISSNNETAQTLANLRDTLLPRLISGQLRLPQAEATLFDQLRLNEEATDDQLAMLLERNKDAGRNVEL